MISCVRTRRPFSGRREGEQIHVCCVGESTGERSWGFVAFQLLTAIMFALRQELCDVGYRHLSTTYCCYRMMIALGWEVLGKVQIHMQFVLIQ